MIRRRFQTTITLNGGPLGERRQIGTQVSLGMQSTKFFEKNYTEIYNALNKISNGKKEWILSVLKESVDGATVLKASSDDYGEQYVIKMNKSRHQNREQFEALAFMHKAGMDCARPLYLDFRMNFYIIEFIDAETLMETLGGENHKNLIEAAGRWLFNLQLAKSNSMFHFKRVQKIKLMFHENNFILNKLYQNLSGRLSRIDGVKMSPVKLHGDFHAGNIFNKNSNLVVFDPQYNRWGSPYQDAARFLLSLSMFREKFKNKGRVWPGDQDCDRRQFFKGYGSLPEKNLAHFDIMEDFIYVNAWLRQWKINPCSENCRILELQIAERGLLSPTQIFRPGRLVSQTQDGKVKWKTEASNWKIQESNKLFNFGSRQYLSLKKSLVIESST